MQIVIQLNPSQLQHMTHEQVGAFVAHCYKLDRLAYVHVTKAAAGNQPYIEIAFYLQTKAELVDSAKIQQQLEAELVAFSQLDPFACPCGCGAFISVSPCHRQSGAIFDHVGCTQDEINTIRRGSFIEAIKMHRSRTGLGLKESKEACDKARDFIMQQESIQKGLTYPPTF